MKRKILQKQLRKLKKNLGRWTFWAGLLFLLVVITVGKTGLLTQVKLLLRKHRLEKSIVEAQELQASLEQKIDSLKSDPKAIEKQVREEFGMGKKDEVIITFEKQE